MSNSNNNTYYQAKLAVSKSLLKEYRTSDSPRTVYMNDGTEFQIQLFNPKSTEIACRVFINDEELSNMIVLRPGERLWLERFTDKAKKFLFETYTVNGNNAQVQEAIKNNGTIRVQFYHKKSRHYQPQVLTTYPYYKWDDSNIISLTNSNDCRIKSYDGCSNKLDISASSTALNSKSYPSVSTISCSDVGFTTSCYYSAADTAAASVSDCMGDAETLAPQASSKKIETGRVTEGSHSNQSFETVNMEFESWAYQTETFKILPTSQKPVHSEDLVKRYCPMCGRKVVEKYKFCPYCGEEL